MKGVVLSLEATEVQFFQSRCLMTGKNIVIDNAKNIMIGQKEFILTSVKDIIDVAKTVEAKRC